jgi:hypothetical protein
VATSSSIAAVQLQIPDEAVDLGFDSSAIGVLLDSGLTQSKTILAVLRGISAKVSSYEDVSESGSSRSVQFFERVRQLIDVWQSVVDKEDIVAGTSAKAGAVIHTSVRV